MEPSVSLRLPEPDVDFPHVACGHGHFPVHMDERVAKTVSPQQAEHCLFTLSPQDLRSDTTETLKCVLNKRKTTRALV